MRACAGSNFANAAVALVVGQPDCHGLCFGLCVKLHRSDFFCVKKRMLQRASASTRRPGQWPSNNVAATKSAGTHCIQAIRLQLSCDAVLMSAA